MSTGTMVTLVKVRSTYTMWCIASSSRQGKFWSIYRTGAHRILKILSRPNRSKKANLLTARYPWRRLDDISPCCLTSGRKANSRHGEVTKCKEAKSNQLEFQQCVAGKSKGVRWLAPGAIKAYFLFVIRSVSTTSKNWPLRLNAI